MTSSERRRPRVVLDTNVWVSAMVWGGSPASIVKAAEEGKVLIVISEEIVEEVSRTLDYHRLREIYEGAGVAREELIEAMLRVGKVVEVGTSSRPGSKSRPEHQPFPEKGLKSGFS